LHDLFSIRIEEHAPGEELSDTSDVYPVLPGAISSSLMHRPTPSSIQTAILDLLDARGTGKTICPSEVARAVAGSDDREQWEPLMQPVRDAARHLVEDEAIVVTQRGRTVAIDTVKGPIRLRRR
jgi:nucleoid-associated protein YgaU